MITNREVFIELILGILSDEQLESEVEHRQSGNARIDVSSITENSNEDEVTFVREMLAQIDDGRLIDGIRAAMSEPTALLFDELVAQASDRALSKSPLPDP